MRYFVVGPDGQQYGPADAATLNQWVTEGRIEANTTLVEEATGVSRRAGEVLNMGYSYAQPSAPTSPQMPPTYGESSYQMPPTYAQPPAYSPQMAGGKDPNSLINQAWIFGTLGLFCCPVIFTTLAIMRSQEAKRYGHPQAQTVFVYSIVMGVLGILVGVVGRLINW